MPYEPTIFDTSAAGFALAPEIMKLDELRKLRGEADRSELDADLGRYMVDKADRARNSDIAAENDFAGFSQHLSSLQGLPPEEIAARNREAMINNPNWLRNQEIKDSINNFQTSNDNVLKTKQNLLAGRSVDAAGKDLDFSEAQRDMEEETLLNNITLKNEQSKAAVQEQKNIMVNKDLDLGKRFGASIGVAKHLSPAVAEKLMNMAGAMDLSDEDEPFVEAISSIVGAHGATANLRAAYADEQAQFKDYYAAAAKHGINIDAVNDPALPPDQRDAMRQQIIAGLSKAGRIESKGNWTEDDDAKVVGAVAAAESAGKARNELNQTEQFLGTVADTMYPLYIKAKNGDLEAKAQLKGKMNVAALRAYKVRGNIEAGLAHRDFRIKTQQDDLKIKKATSELLSMASTRENAAARTAIAQRVQEFRESGKDINLIMKAFGIASKSGKLKLKTAEEVASFLDNLKTNMEPVLDDESKSTFE